MVVAGVSYWLDKKGLINLGKWDNIITITLGFLAIISLFFPLERTKPDEICQVKVNKIITERDLIEPNQTMNVTVSIENPESLALVFNWQALNGIMKPGLRTNSIQSNYTAPQTLVDDLISVEVVAVGCPSVETTKDIKVINPLLDTDLSKDNLSSLLELDGTWKGITEHGHPITFKVVGNKVYGIGISYLVFTLSEGTLCPVLGGVSIPEADIVDNSFIFISKMSDIDFEIIGEFESSILAIGSFYVPDQPYHDGACGIFSSKWEATKE